ncbi:hypothetical protein L227DRAFT_63820 [Lentinus tigrinus ALCF2SS1-6]|uniref:Uncharacterized protein n=1 Tax=Lentinus tigrinus ALCF2SS1-6 TaxID=1328759 RepID=A0A5C2SDA3_9APHY|nr:hypothetical protein L227DRAFT_63820 [Lentinus tigrinus ALCF2SS1-6]
MRDVLTQEFRPRALAPSLVSNVTSSCLRFLIVCTPGKEWHLVKPYDHDNSSLRTYLTQLTDTSNVSQHVASERCQPKNRPRLPLLSAAVPRAPSQRLQAEERRLRIVTWHR